MYWLPYNRAPFVATLVSVSHVWHDTKRQWLEVHQPCPLTDAQVRSWYLREGDAPEWWLCWKSTQQWIADLQPHHSLDAWFGAAA